MFTQSRPESSMLSSVFQFKPYHGLVFTIANEEVPSHSKATAPIWFVLFVDAWIDLQIINLLAQARKV